MNELFAMMQKMNIPPASPLAMMEMPQIRFRDILQLLLLSAAVKIVNRAYLVLNRLGMTPGLPLQNQPQQLGIYGYPVQQMPVYPNFGPTQPQMPELIAYPYPADEQKGE